VTRALMAFADPRIRRDCLAGLDSESLRAVTALQVFGRVNQRTGLQGLPLELHEPRKARREGKWPRKRIERSPFCRSAHKPNRGARPSNEIETMLVGQMAVTHDFALELLGRARRVEEIQQFDSSGNMAVKLLRTFGMQAEALAKLRRGGEQTVRVEHVHVYPGGQAVVGNITAQPGGRGGEKNGGQAHATNDPRAFAFAPGSPVWSADAERKALPVARGERQEKVPDARRRKG
jgi:hypothetical protein